MRILINGSTLKKGGVLQVGHSLIAELLKRTDHEYYFIVSSGLKDFFQPLEKEDRHRFFFHDVKPKIYLSLTGKERRLNSIFHQVKPDVVLSVFGPTYWKPDGIHVCGYAKAVYFYPDSPFIQRMPLKRKIKLLLLKTLHLHDFKRFNQALITETSDTANRLSSLLPDKTIFTVSNTYNQVFNKPKLWDKSIKLPEFSGLTMLSITANYRHKNLRIIPEVIAYLKANYPSLKFRFILTLTEGEFGSIKEEYAKHIVFLGRVSIFQCPYLYSQSDVMFMPTLLECFSATYPEAMKMRTPILTSDLPFARDVCKDAAMYFDPMSPRSIGEAIHTLADNESIRLELIERGLVTL